MVTVEASLIILAIIIVAVYFVAFLRNTKKKIKFYFDKINGSEWLAFLGVVCGFAGTIYLTYSSSADGSATLNGKALLTFDYVKFTYGIRLIIVSFFFQILSYVVYFYNREMLN
jgi:hypothetical protein